MPTAEALVPEPFSVEVKSFFKTWKTPSTDQITTELIQAGGNILRSENNWLTN
jgi:hypothetical protein